MADLGSGRGKPYGPVTLKFSRICFKYVTNSDILSHAGIGPLAEQISRRRTTVFGHITRLADNVPTRLVLRCQIDASLGHLSSNTWKRRRVRPKNRWLGLVRQDSNCFPADLRRRAVLRGHGARTNDATIIACYVELTTMTM